MQARSGRVEAAVVGDRRAREQGLRARRRSSRRARGRARRASSQMSGKLASLLCVSRMSDVAAGTIYRVAERRRRLRALPPCRATPSGRRGSRSATGRRPCRPAPRRRCAGPASERSRGSPASSSVSVRPRLRGRARCRPGAMPSATTRRAGPAREVGVRSARRAPRSRASSRPSTTSPARSSTAVAYPTGEQTTFAQTCMP